MRRDADILTHDIDLITQQLAERSPLPNGKKPLSEFINNALLYASGMADIENELKAIQKKINAS